MQVIGRGISHPQPCGASALLANIQGRLVQEPRAAESLASSLIKQKISEAPAGAQQIGLASGKREFKVPLPSTAASTSKALFPGATPIPATEVHKWQTLGGFSNAQMKTNMQVLRQLKGRDTFESNTLTALSIMDKELAPFFNWTECKMDSDKKAERENGAKVDRIVVFAEKFPELVHYLCSKRGWHVMTEIFKKVGMDGGGGFMKICLNLIRVQNELSSPAKSKTRQTYQDGLCTNKFKDNGVRKLIILAIVQGVQETHYNMKVLFDLLGITKISFSACSDMKMANIVCGIGTCASKYPCYICKQPKLSFQEEIFGDSQKYPLRTLGDVRKHAKAYQAKCEANEAAGKAKPSAMDWYSCSSQPLLDGDDSELLIDLMAPMELHLMLGIVNDLYAAIAAKNQTLAEEWSKTVGKISLRYGGQWNGNQCNVLLSEAKTNELTQLLIPLGEKAIAEGGLLVDALVKFRAVKHSSFGMVRRRGYEQDIRDFASSFLKTGLSVTPKVHVVCAHVVPFLKRNPQGNRGLGYYSEQSSESVHHHFLELWDAGYARTPGHPNYAEQLKKAVVAFGSKRI